jgi:hypothetical protein
MYALRAVYTTPHVQIICIEQDHHITIDAAISTYVYLEKLNTNLY